jgi:hypothetical protein
MYAAMMRPDASPGARPKSLARSGAETGATPEASSSRKVVANSAISAPRESRSQSREVSFSVMRAA